MLEKHFIPLNDFLVILIFLFHTNTNKCYFLLTVIGQTSYYVPLLGSNNERRKSTQTLINKGLYKIEGFSDGISFTSFYCVFKRIYHSSSSNEMCDCSGKVV